MQPLVAVQTGARARLLTGAEAVAGGSALAREVPWLWLRQESLGKAPENLETLNRHLTGNGGLIDL